MSKSIYKYKLLTTQNIVLGKTDTSIGLCELLINAFESGGSSENLKIVVNGETSAVNSWLLHHTLDQERRLHQMEYDVEKLKGRVSDFMAEQRIVEKREAEEKV